MANKFADMTQEQKGQAIRQMQYRTGANIKQIAAVMGVNYNTARRWAGQAPDYVALDTDDDVMDALLAVTELSQAVRAKLDPVVTHAEFSFEGSVALLMAGCMHFGGRWTNHKFIRERIKEILDVPGARIAFFGDDIENFHARSFAGAKAVYDQALTPDLQRVAFELFLENVKDNVLWATWGQHSHLWDERYGWRAIKDLYLERGITFFDGMGYVKLHVGEQTYNVAVSHEFPGNSMYNKVHPHKRALWQRFPNADVVAQADKHCYAVHQESHYVHEYLAGNRASPFVTLVQVGTAKTGADPYTVRGWEYGAGEWPIVFFDARQHRVKVTNEVSDVRFWLSATTS